MPKPVKVVVVAKDKDARIQANKARTRAREARALARRQSRSSVPHGTARGKRRLEKQRAWAAAGTSLKTGAPV